MLKRIICKIFGHKFNTCYERINERDDVIRLWVWRKYKISQCERCEFHTKKLIKKEGW